MRVLAVIPARAGSRRLPGKNTRMLGGHPLVAWSIVAARNSECFVDVVVSSDSHDILDISRRYGAMVQGVRPESLATDHASSADVVIYEVAKYAARRGEVDAVMLLQPTSPFRTTSSIRAAIEMFRGKEHIESLVSISPSRVKPQWVVRKIGRRIVPFFEGRLMPADEQEAFELNGAIYLIRWKKLRDSGKFIFPDTNCLVMTQPFEGIDIDTGEDWLVAEAAMRLFKFGGCENSQCSRDRG